MINTRIPLVTSHIVRPGWPRISKIAICIITIILTILSCKNESSPQDPTTDKLNEVKINLKTEPDRLNPVLSTQLTARQIERFIFPPLEDYNPSTLQLEPVLLTQKPVITQIQEGPHTGGVKYKMKILDEAAWNNGMPVTGEDYLFTLKLLFNPYLAQKSLSSYYESIIEVQIDSLHPKKLTVITNQKYMLGEEIVCGLQIYPRHIYDNDGLLSDLSLLEIKNDDPSSDDTTSRRLEKFADAFNSNQFSREIVEGCGPYRLVEWTADQQIILEKKPAYWAEKLTNPHPLLRAHPERLKYFIVPDEQTAFTNLKSGNLDILSDVSPQQLKSVEDIEGESSLTAYSPAVLQYYFIAYNNQHYALKDSKVRNALSHLMDVKSLINELFYGLALPTIGPVNPTKTYYNKSLEPISFDVALAKKLLNESGWTDTNDDGILDKIIDGQQKSLSLRIYTTRSQLSQDVAVLLKTNATSAGVDIDIIPNDFGVFIPEMRKGNFELATLASVQTIGYTDPYNSWHSDNTGPTGSNLCKMRNEEVDQIIESIRSTIDESERNQLYIRLQEVIYQQQPALFLLSPKTRLIANSRLNLITSAIRPGYYENLTTLK